MNGIGSRGAGIYLDWNATAPLRPAALAAMTRAINAGGNPSSVHASGRRARAFLDDAREAVAALTGANPALVIFTSGGTEANNLALLSRGRRPLIVSAIEHDSVLRPARAAEAAIARVQRSGEIDLEHLAYLIDRAGEPAFVSIMLANNETGLIQPMAAITRLAKAKGALVHCDASQAAGRIPIDMQTLGVDYLTLSAHKLGGPLGAGALVLGGDVPLVSLILGGGQERGRRAGTENVPAIAGFGAAARDSADLADSQRLGAMRDTLENRLLSGGQPVTIFGRAAQRLPNTSCFAAGSKTAETLVMGLDLAGIAVSAGAACSSGKVRPSHVISAMGFDAATAGSAIRVSLGWGNDPSDVDAFLAAWSRLHRPSTAGVGAGNIEAPAA